MYLENLIHLSPTYIMVLLNVASLVCLTIGLFSYRYIYPKKQIPFLLLALLYSILPVISILRPGIPESGDFTLHSVFLMDFSKSLSEGNLFPQWAANAAGGFGYPAFEFMYLTPFYLGSLFHFIGFGYITSIKLLLITSYFLSCVTMYFWAKKEFGDSFSAFVATLFYQFAPFYFIEMHFYQSVGMTLAFTILPLSFYSLRQFMTTKRYFWFCATALSLGLAILTHLTMATFLLPLLIGYAIVLYKTQKTTVKILVLSITALMTGVILMTYYWLPLISESKYIIQGSSSTRIVVPEKFIDLVYSPWGYGFLLQGSDAKVKFLIGYAQWIVVFLASLLLLTKRLSRSENVKVWFYLITFIVLLVLMLPVSSKIWELPVLNNFRSTNRLLLFEAFFAAALAAVVSQHLGKLLKFLSIQFDQIRVANIIIWIVCMIAVGSTVLAWANRGTLPVTEEILLTTAASRMTDYSLVPIWFQDDKTGPFFDKLQAEQHIEILKGTGFIKELQRTTTRHTYILQANSPLRVLENTTYFPGWKVRIDNKEVPIMFTTKHYPGLLVFDVTQGKHSVEVFYTPTPIRQTAQTISVIILIILLAYLLKIKFFYIDKPHQKFYK